MTEICVKQIMVPLSEYAAVSDRANLVEAVQGPWITPKDTRSMH